MVDQCIRLRLYAWVARLARVALEGGAPELLQTGYVTWLFVTLRGLFVQKAAGVDRGDRNGKPKLRVSQG